MSDQVLRRAQMKTLKTFKWKKFFIHYLKTKVYETSMSPSQAIFSKGNAAQAGKYLVCTRYELQSVKLAFGQPKKS